MRVQAEAGEGELRHIGAPDRHEALRQHAGDDGCMGPGGSGVGEHHRPCRGDLPGDVEQVLEADGDAGIGARRAAVAAEGVGCVGLGAGGVGSDGDEGERALARRVGNPVQALLD